MNENKLLKNIVLNYLREAISGYIHDSKKEILYGDLKIRIEYSRDEKFGDYSSPVALENKSIFGENPKTTAEEIIKRIPGDSFESVSFSPPGFINFRIGKSFLISYLQETVMSPVASNIFAKSDKTEKIIFEFVSANPTGPLNIVSARAAAVGDSICNLLSKAGHEVQREFYVNDFGNQVFLLGVSCLARLREILGEPVKIEEEGENPGLEEILRENIIPMEGYRGEYISAIARSVYSSPEKKNEIDSHIAKKEYKILAEKFSDWAVEANLGSQKEDLISFGVKFDNFYSEKALHENGKVPAALKSLQKSGDTKTEEGKEIFISTKFGDDKDRVIVRDDGRPTYLLADIAYHLSKIERGFTKLINIWGPDHHGYIARLKGALISLGYP
ncbi:MAG: arginine--tRNA ligase, partial [Leptospira sp.]|nr:arginine--tRNA ligase [Leptospira sp.]